MPTRERKNDCRISCTRSRSRAGPPNLLHPPPSLWAPPRGVPASAPARCSGVYPCRLGRPLAVGIRRSPEH